MNCHGCAVEILMRFYSTMRKKGVLLKRKGVWRNFAKLWRIVIYMTSALWETLSLGGIITMMLQVI
jgi:hypothetical protein